MHLTLKSLIVICLSILFVSCQDNMVEEEFRISKQDLLTNTWRVTDIRSGGTSILPVVDRLQCITDNILIFSPDGSFLITEGANVCNPAFAGSGTWALVDNETKIKWNFTAPQTREVFVPIVELSNTTLKISYIFGNEVPLPGAYEMVLQKQ